MEDLVASYLFKNKKCSLPGIGSLHLKQSTASTEMGEKLLQPPSPYIFFEKLYDHDNEFIDFISESLNISSEKATETLSQFCNNLLLAHPKSEFTLPQVGKLFVNKTGEIVFNEETFPSALLPSVRAERISHPDTSHAIIVGDMESDSTQMTEYLSYEEPLKKRRRWILWAVIMAVIALLTIMFYLSDSGERSYFGNGRKVPAQTAPKPYSE